MDKYSSMIYRTALRLSLSCAVTLDKGGNVVDFDSYINDIPKDATPGFIDQKFTDIFVPVDQQHCNSIVAEMIVNKTETSEKILTKYADSLYIEWRLTPINWGGAVQEQPGIFGAGIDVTKHVELKQQLEHTNRLATVGQLAAGIAHEINGPLNNILGYAQLSAKQQDLPEQVYQDLDNIIRMSLHAREVVKKVMLFSRQVPPKYDLIRLNDVIRESTYFTEPLCGKNNIRINCRLDDGLPELKGDFAQLRQVVVNLVVNAVQAMPDGDGKITITTGQKDTGELTMTVQDTGIGMTAETLSRCFDPFFTTKEMDGGTGLGLSVVQGIIKAHDAEIDVSSQSGEGSCFTVIFTAKSWSKDKDEP